MITKVVLGVALVLIEFSIITRSQNKSLSVHNDTSNESYTTVSSSNFSSSETKTSSDFTPTEASITNSYTSTTIKLKNISNFTTTLSPDTSTRQQHETTTTATASTDFQLPENCSAYKVSFSITKCFLLLISILSFCLSF